jgi:hypothetical protein
MSTISRKDKEKMKEELRKKLKDNPLVSEIY